LRHGSRPNPFNPMVEIWFEMPARGEAQVEILDQRGRIVRTVFASTCEAGRRICTWDGKNAQGTAAGSGVYMYRVRAAGLSATGKVTLTR
jgi:flagellar hook assembly protein FlgD